MEGILHCHQPRRLPFLTAWPIENIPQKQLLTTHCSDGTDLRVYTQSSQLYQRRTWIIDPGRVRFHAFLEDANLGPFYSKHMHSPRFTYRQSVDLFSA